MPQGPNPSRGNGAMTAPQAPDPIDQAIAAASPGPQMARAQFVINAPDGKGGMTNKPVAVEVPTDLTENEAFVAIGQIWNVMRQVTLQAEQKKTGGLVLAKGALPPLPR